nr:MAG TPA: hypothetical protein [Caudoviricetes sp.]
MEVITLSLPSTKDLNRRHKEHPSDTYLWYH